MGLKIRGGKIQNEAAFVKPKHVGKSVKSVEFGTMFGAFLHQYKDDWGNLNSFSVTAEIADLQIVTEDNKVNFTGALGWGAVGGILTGGVGLLAGAVLGGMGKEAYAALRFKDGSQFMVSGKPKDLASLMKG